MSLFGFHSYAIVILKPAALDFQLSVNRQVMSMTSKTDLHLMLMAVNQRQPIGPMFTWLKSAGPSN